MNRVIAIKGPGGAVLVGAQQRGPLVLAGMPRSSRRVISAGQLGPAGKTGEPGPPSGAAFQRQAGEALSALRAVYELDGQVFALDAGDEDHIDLLLGLTLTAADAGAPINVQRSGAVNDTGWNWAIGPIWLGPGGMLTQTPPVDGFDVLIGAAVSATRITLNIQDPINLE